MNINGLGANAVAVDSNGVPLDINGQPLFSGSIGTDSVSSGSVSDFFTSLTNGITRYATAQQTNTGISTLSTVAMVGIVVWGAVHILGKK